MADADSKVCRRCGESLPHSSFYANSKNKDGLQSRCKPCHLAMCNERYHRTKVLRPLSPTQICAHCGNEFPRPQPKKPGDPPRCSTKHCSLACRFWSKVDKSGGPDACWVWIAKARCQSGTGYGNFGISQGKYIHAHRQAWELTKGKIPEGLHGCHKCDNVLCCNPSHLFLGSHVENMDDMVSKGRGWNLSKDPSLVERLRQAKIGKPRSEATKEKLRIASTKPRPWAKGVPNGQKGIPKPKQSEAMKAYWARRKA
jgi:hypothetical protein